MHGVTAPTPSEFGGALQQDDRASDDSGGSHHLVMGGAVNSRRVYGWFLTVILSGSADALRAA